MEQQIRDTAVYLETFGCQMNELDSELVAGELGRLGYRFTDNPKSADVVLYNTCSVREQAEQKVWSRLGELAKRKATQPNLVVGVLGCLAERDGVDLINRMPVVDILCGPAELDKLPALLDNACRTRLSMTSHPVQDPHVSERSASEVALQGSASRRSSTLAAAEDSLELLDLSRSISPVDTTRSFSRSAYVRITRGCNKFCTYCVVPFTRGAEIHRPPEHIIDECRKLADAGVVEITLLGQTVNHYRFEHGAAVAVNGVTQPQKGRTYKGSHNRDALAGDRVTTFADLLHQIHESVPEIKRLRFVTSYPRDFGDDVLEVMRDSPRICRYLHVPAQSGSNRILQKMNRGYTIEEYDEFLDRARSFLHQPEIGRPLMVSGDIIVGFPTETDEDYEKTVQLVQRARYKNCFIFKYSPRPGTVAFDRIPDDVPDQIKRKRNNHLLALQSMISDEISKEQIGLHFDILVEGISKQARKAAGMTNTQIRNLNAVSLTVNGESMRASTPEQTFPADGILQLSGRTDGDQIVFFDAPAADVESTVGSIVSVTICSADKLSLHGTLNQPALI
ncbi:MAG: MiaB/RimO family radical SAM methylthiotransferase [Phycisphaeraceae bacterium]|nr:MiaB/RimO family radical SAM methylthiotransferase [Phycisphaerales bacterium]MCB9861350.1 MiaB/RimO family radical SAM methylthiotransferase [Phycisphaeraceae bacterium]